MSPPTTNTAEPLAVQWGARIRSRRQKLGLSQTDLAEAVGISQAAIARYESGTRRPGADTQRDIARALEREPGQIFHW